MCDERDGPATTLEMVGTMKERSKDEGWPKEVRVYQRRRALEVLRGIGAAISMFIGLAILVYIIMEVAQ